MKKKVLKIDSIYAVISLLSLLYINYYQTILYNKPMLPYSGIYDFIYQYITIASFYCFLAAFITYIILDFIHYNLPKKVIKILTYIISLALIIYILLVLIKIIGFKLLPYYGFISNYSVIFSVTGCLIAFASHKNPNI
ncbi:MAG: hypothetical protein K0R92_1539 [Lachnospiraceae bacterium]|jgi:hypothetical protein|nr:hypothetical protein [Lachnospiraceae bacterium]